mmetsp:Transcript_82841/g.165350  ORF Transcript_82841/g.165350 Transcript_82841/m.165350 type:complete len:246 (-) Transcript_82841:549-1286(-)
MPQRWERFIEQSIVFVQDGYMAIGMGYVSVKGWVAGLFGRLLDKVRSRAPEVTEKLDDYQQQVQGNIDGLRYQADEYLLKTDATVREKYPRTVAVTTQLCEALKFQGRRLLSFCRERVLPEVSTRVSRQYKELADSSGALLEEVNAKVLVKIRGEPEPRIKTPAHGARATAEERAMWAEEQRLRYEIEMAKLEEERILAELISEEEQRLAMLRGDPLPASGAAAAGPAAVGPAAAPAAAAGPLDA